jgi:hypothetical protein
MTVSPSRWPTRLRLCTPAGRSARLCLPARRPREIVATVPLAALLGETMWVQVQAFALLSVAPDVVVDGLVTDRDLLLES